MTDLASQVKGILSSFRSNGVISKLSSREYAIPTSVDDVTLDVYVVETIK